MELFATATHIAGTIADQFDRFARIDQAGGLLGDRTRHANTAFVDRALRLLPALGEATPDQLGIETAAHPTILRRRDRRARSRNERVARVRTVIPLHDDNPTRRRAVVTIALVLVNIAVYVLLQPHGSTKAVVSLPTQQGASLFRVPEEAFLFGRAAIPCELVHHRPLREAELEALSSGEASACGVRAEGAARARVFPGKSVWLAALSSMFLHGGWIHLLGNMLFLWIFGNNIEDRFGRLLYVGFYLVAGIVATAAHALVAPSSLVPLVGASGAIAGVMGAYLVLYPRVRIRTVIFLGIPLPLKIPAWAMLTFWFVSQFFVSPTEGVAWMAHVGGFAFGALVGFVVRSRAKAHLAGVPHWA